ncbi:MAG: hypothetical protein ACRDYY_18260 [Acidimicrobiales bacterium]
MPSPNPALFDPADASFRPFRGFLDRRLIRLRVKGDRFDVRAGRVVRTRVIHERRLPEAP